MNERGRNNVIEALWQTTKAVRFEINDPGHNLEKTREHLKTGSILLYTNHFSTLDTTVLARFIDKTLGLENLSIFAGRKHLDPQRGASSKLKRSLVMNFAQAKGFSILQVVQAYEFDKYPDAATFNKNAKEKAIEALSINGQILAIAPEGTRSRTGGLIKAQPGISILFRNAKDNAVALPIAMHPYKIIPPFTKTTVEVGNPFTYEEIEMEHALYPNISITDLMMKRLAVLLPTQNRGVYV